jgi:hypothetical protein
MSFTEDLRQNNTEMNKRKDGSFLTACKSFQRLLGKKVMGYD